jgi:hypothetical protein
VAPGHWAAWSRSQDFGLCIPVLASLNISPVGVAAVRRAATTLGLALLLVGCGSNAVTLLTGTDHACWAGGMPPVEGLLLADPDYGTVIQDPAYRNGLAAGPSIVRVMGPRATPVGACTAARSRCVGSYLRASGHTPRALHKRGRAGPIADAALAATASTSGRGQPRGRPGWHTSRR